MLQTGRARESFNSFVGHRILGNLIADLFLEYFEES
jgi:hypothetical protein